MNKWMRAVVLTGHGGLDCLRFSNRHPRPEPGPGEVLVRVHACGLNNTDVNTRTGWYSKSVSEGTTGGPLDSAKEDDASWGGGGVAFPRIQGADVCGTVAETGDGSSGKLVGRRVLIDPWIRDWTKPGDRGGIGFFGSETDGGFADFTVVPVEQAHPIESGFGDAELATFATSWVTALNMLDRASVSEGDRLLVTGASGGVGSALVQLGRLRGAEVIAMCATEKVEQLRKLNPAAILPRSPEDLGASLMASTGKASVTAVADIVGGEMFQQLLDVLEPGGRYVVSGAIAGPDVRLDLRQLYLKDLSLFGATVTDPNTFGRLIKIIESGKVEPVLAAVYPLEKLREAQEEFIAKRHIGNIVVRV